MDVPVRRSKVPLGGLILMILLAVVAGVAIGAIVAAVESYLHFYLILVFAIFEGALAGGIVALGVTLGKVRSRGVVVMFAIIAGLIAYGVYWYGDYYLFKQQIYSDRPQNSKQELDQGIDAILTEETGQAGIVGFVMYQAQEGFGITSTSNVGDTHSSSDITLKGPTAYGYFAVELLLIIGVAAAIAGKAAGAPFCEKDNRFFVLRSAGRVPKDSADQFMTMARAGDWRGASMLVDRSRGKVRYPYLDIEAQRCPACNTNQVPVSVIRKLGSRKRSQKVVFKTTLTPEQYSDFANVPLEPLPVTAY